MRRRRLLTLLGQIARGVDVIAGSSPSCAVGGRRPARANGTAVQMSAPAVYLYLKEELREERRMARGRKEETSSFTRALQYPEASRSDVIHAQALHPRENWRAARGRKRGVRQRRGLLSVRVDGGARLPRRAVRRDELRAALAVPRVAGDAAVDRPASGAEGRRGRRRKHGAADAAAAPPVRDGAPRGATGDAGPPRRLRRGPARGGSTSSP